MARGFESKDVEFQQAEAERGRTIRRTLTPEERDAASKRRGIELSLRRVREELGQASRPAHREMLVRAIDALERELSIRD